MRVILVLIFLFVFSLFLSLTAQHQYVARDSGPDTISVSLAKKDTMEKLNMPPGLIIMARFSKIIYTGETKFEFEVPKTTHDYKRDQ